MSPNQLFNYSFVAFNYKIKVVCGGWFCQATVQYLFWGQLTGYLCALFIHDKVNTKVTVQQLAFISFVKPFLVTEYQYNIQQYATTKPLTFEN